MRLVDPLYAPVSFSFDPPKRPVAVATYPLKAIVYFFAHPSLWKIIICPFLITAIIAITAFVLIFSLALYPQYLLMEDLTDITWLSWIVAVLLCLVEIFFVVLCTFLVFFDGTRKRIYKKVFEIEGVVVRPIGDDTSFATLDEETIMSSLNENCACWMFIDIAEAIKGCLLCCCIDRKDCGWYLLMKVISLLIFLISLPLNLIPVVGTVLFCAINGTLMAWRLQLNYFKAKKLPPSVCSYILKHRFSEYLSFGSICMFLDLIPLIDVLLVYTNIIASGE